MKEEDKKRTEIADLAAPEEELTDEQAKSVEGGTFYGRGVLKSTDGGQTWSNTTVGGSLSSDPSYPSKT